MKKLKEKVKERSCMCGRLLGIRPQAMYESWKKIKTFLDGVWDERSSREKFLVQPDVID